MQQFDGCLQMLISVQLRAARALLQWSAMDLAERAGLHLTTVQRIERTRGPFRCNVDTLRKLESALIDFGVEFIDDRDRPGVCLDLKRVKTRRHVD